MTKPAQSRQRRGRVYVWPPEPGPDGEYELEVPSVTAIVGGGIPKRFLMYWAAKKVAEWAYDHRDAWRDLPKDAAVDLLKRAHSRYTGKRADVGTAVHAAAEAHASGKPEPELSEEEHGYFEGALRFFKDHDPEILEVESTVYSRNHGYAGTPDLFLRLQGKVLVADWKTGKDIYPETALQLAAYAHGDFIGRDDGTEDPVPPAELGLGIRLTSDGDYQAYPLLVTDEVLDMFLAAQKVHGWRKLKRRVKGEELVAA